MHTHTQTRAHTHMKKTPDEKQTGSEVQAKDLEKIVGIFYVGVVPILKDLLAAGNNGLEYRLPSFPANFLHVEVTFSCFISSPTETSSTTLTLNGQKKIACITNSHICSLY